MPDSITGRNVRDASAQDRPQSTNRTATYRRILRRQDRFSGRVPRYPPSFKLSQYAAPRAAIIRRRCHGRHPPLLNDEIPRMMFDHARSILKTLVSHDTTSCRSNLPLVGWIADLLERAGCEVRVTSDTSGRKANLLARMGPACAGGILLSGHTDVVPVEHQSWTTDPFTLRESDDKFFARGAVDMKGFVACCLEGMVMASGRHLQRPLMLALSHDEELGCLGAPALVADLATCGWPLPSWALVGEPTQMRIATAHKGVIVGHASFRGKAAHSSDPRAGVNAIEFASDFVCILRQVAERLQTVRTEFGFDPAYTTFNIGRIEGGEALNIVPSICAVTWEFRLIPEADASAIWNELKAAIALLQERMRMASPEASVTFERLASVPPLRHEPGGLAEQMARRLSGSNDSTISLPFGTEAGYFQTAGIPTIVCGPGSIEQAHKPDEWISIEQFEAGRRLIAAVVADAALQR